MFSFRCNNKQAAAHRFVRRLIDASTPNLTQGTENERLETRSNRTLPVLLAPLENGRPVISQAAFALTKDLSSQGVALVLPQALPAGDVVVVLWSESDPAFILGRLVQATALGGGFWQLGVELAGLTSLAEMPALQAVVPLAAKLVPVKVENVRSA